MPVKPSGIPISAAPPRPRISVHHAESLRHALGKRDLTRGERGLVAEILLMLQGLALRLGFPSNPVKPQVFKPVVSPEGFTANAEDGEQLVELVGDSADERVLKSKRIDGVRDMLAAIAAGELPADTLTPAESELVPLMLAEAITDFRPHAGHPRALPTHVLVARRKQAAAAAQSAALVDSVTKSVTAAVTNATNAAQSAVAQGAGPASTASLQAAQAAHGRIDALERQMSELKAEHGIKLDAILEHLTKAPTPPPTPTPTPSTAPTPPTS